MPNISTQMYLETTLSTANSFIKNMDDYAYYLSQLIYKRINSRKFHTTSKLFGELEITIDANQYCCITDKGQFSVYVNFEYSAVDEDAIVDTLNQDKQLLDTIGREISTFIRDLNPNLSDIQVIKNENVIFENEHFYIEVSPFNAKHETEWVKFEIDDNVYDTEQLGNNI